MRTILLLPLIAALAACQSGEHPQSPGTTAQPGARVTLNGVVTYRQRIALPPNARVTVTLSDVSLMDVAAPVIAQTELDTAGRQVPIPFALDYDSAKIVPRHNYAVSARITDASGKLMWITDTRFDLPKPGTPIELMVVQVP